jgi:hypothetical protein
MSKVTTQDRLALKTPEASFLHVLQDEFNFSLRVSRELLATAQEMLIGSAPAQTVRPGQVRLVVARLSASFGPPLGETDKVEVTLTVDAGGEDESVKKQEGTERLRQGRILRLTEEALEQGGVLTQEDLARALSVNVRTIRRSVKALKEEGHLVQTRGAIKGVGRCQSHKVRIIELWLDRERYDKIAMWVHHSPQSIQRYVSTQGDGGERDRVPDPVVGTAGGGLPGSIRSGDERSPSPGKARGGSGTGDGGSTACPRGRKRGAEMSRVNPYGSIAKRNFESAMMHMLATEYGLLGGRRILRLLVDDTLALMEEHYPPQERVGSGDLVWTCTADEGKKAEPGKRTEEYKTVTVKLPFVTLSDLHERTEKKVAKSKTREAARQRDKRRVARMVKAADQQGGLLTVAELSVIVNRSYEITRRYIREWEEETGEMLPLKGYRMDQGSRPTHKREIARLYEQGVEPPDIARETRHSLKSVERYLGDYERVKLLLKRGAGSKEISTLIGRGERVVLEYVALAREYHPELFVQET